MGTGAFSKMNTGDRTVSVRVVNVLIQIDGSNTQRAKGVNPDSEYYFDRVFEIVNKDADRNEHHVWISSNTADPVDFYWKGDPSNSAEGPNNSWQLLSGSALGAGMSVDASGLAPDQYIEGNVVISTENTNN